MLNTEKQISSQEAVNYYIAGEVVEKLGCDMSESNMRNMKFVLESFVQAQKWNR